MLWAMSVFSSSALSRGNDLMKSGVLSITPLSAPSNTTSMAPALIPVLLSTSRSRTPAHLALPIAPEPHSTPGTCGMDKPRRLPAH